MYDGTITNQLKNCKLTIFPIGPHLQKSVSLTIFCSVKLYSEGARINALILCQNTISQNMEEGCCFC